MSSTSAFPAAGGPIAPVARAGDADRPPAARRRRRRGRGVLEGLAVGLLALACAAWALKLWRADLGLPLRYTAVDDTKFYLMLVKALTGHGWIWTNSTLGAPFGQQLYDFPQGADDLNFVLIRFFALFSANPALVANLFYLTTYVLSGFTCYLAARALGVSRPSAALTAVLFSLLPYHFFRGESHMLLSAYYAVPLAAYLFLSLLANRDLFERRRRPGPPLLRWLTWRSAGTVALCLVIGSESLYYASLAEALLVGATVVLAFLRRSRRQVATGAVLVATVGLTVGANLAPALVYQLRHGANHEVVRSAVQDESHGLKLTNLVLPNPNSRIAPLRHVAEKYDNAVAPSYCEACYASLGTLGTAGFLWLGLCGLGALAGAAAWFGSRRQFRHAALGVALSLIVATIGGVSSLVEFFVTPDIRGWNRISLFVAFFSLLAVGLVADRLLMWQRTSRVRRVGGPLAIAALLAFGVYDETSGYFVPAYSDIAREYRSDGAFVAAIQARLPAGSSVLQLPYVPFPEGYPLTATSGNVPSFDSSYELARGYLHSTQLRWSWGATKGRAGDWSAQLATKPLSVVPAAAASAGFDGIWVDPQGYPADGGAQVRTGLQTLLGEAPLTSPDGDLWFFDLRAFRARVQQSHSGAAVKALRQATLYPLRAACSSSGASLVNPGAAPRAATLTLTLTAGGPGQPVQVGYPDGSGQSVTVGTAPLVVRHRLLVAPGTSRVRVGAAAGAGLQVAAATLSDDSYLPFAGDRRPVTQTPAGLVGPPCAV